VGARRCIVVGSIAPPAGNLERVTLLAHTLRRAGAPHVTAVLPYLAYARQDRAGPTESLGLAWAGALLRAAGVDEVVSVDVHSGAASEVLGLSVTSLSPAKALAAVLPRDWREDATFVAPDDGAVDRCVAVARVAGSCAPIVSMRKRRTRTGVEHIGVAGSAGRRAVVVDDILDTGGTLVSCCRALRRAGTEEIAIVVTHGLFTGSAWRALFDHGVEWIWITDTVLAPRRPPGVEIVGVGPLVAPVLTAPDSTGDRHHA
jgi:ribose-phosphate pyrophosphokinase